jgi:hypothetical protein
MRRGIGSLAAIASLVVALVLIGAGPADASSSIEFSDEHTLKVAGDGGDNHVVIALVHNGFSFYDRISDSSGISTVPASCMVNDAYTVDCPAMPDLVLDLGAGNDTVSMDEDCFTITDVDLGEGDNSVRVPDCGGQIFTVTAGGGRDTLTTEIGSSLRIVARLGGANDELSGGAGGDTLIGGGGKDRISGGAGRDRLSGGSGNDRLNGGAGRDSCSGGGGSNVVTHCET